MEIVYRQPNWDPLIRLLSRKEYADLDVDDCTWEMWAVSRSINIASRAGI